MIAPSSPGRTIGNSTVAPALNDLLQRSGRAGGVGSDGLPRNAGGRRGLRIGRIGTPGGSVPAPRHTGGTPATRVAPIWPGDLGIIILCWDPLLGRGAIHPEAAG